MKKNISINLQGIIFHIEEDGYDQLSQYLAAIKSYFSTYEGHEEITADIEARMAEIFFAKLSPNKQVITRDDVQALIAQMGSVKDFELLEEEENQAKSSGYGQTYGGYNTTGDPIFTNTPGAGSKRIYRDQTRKVIGGVAAGIAHYMAVDPLLIRLGFIILTGLFIISGGFSAVVVVIAYLCCWAAFPPSSVLPETPSKKLFRNPSDKKLGGVASGIALFFGMDVAIIRLLFLIFTILGGVGLLIYFVLWIIIPEANSITDRVQMEGNPVTLSGIEESLKNNLRMKDENGQESQLARLILFPVRLIAQVLQFLARVLGPVLNFLVALIRILAGALLLLLAGLVIFALFVMVATALNIIDGSSIIDFGDMPFSLFVNSFPPLGMAAGFFTVLIPAILLLLLGLGLLLKRFYLRAAVGWSMFAVWVLSIFILVLAIIDFRNDFRESGEYVTQKSFPAANYQTIVLKARDTGSFRNGRAYLDVESYAGPEIRLMEEFRAKGLNEAQAIKNARMITYRTSQQDSIITFDYNFKFKPEAIYREQELNLKLLLPENKKFKISEDLAYMLPSSAFEDDYNNSEIAIRTWQIKNSKFICLDCPAPDTTGIKDEENFENNDQERSNLESPLFDEDDYGDQTRQFENQDFERIEVGGIYHVKIRKGDRFSIQAQGEGELFRNISVSQSGDELKIGARNKMFRFSFSKGEPVLITITMPELKELDLSGAVKADVSGFTADEFNLSASGAVESLIDITSREINIENNGACDTRVTGSGETITIDANGASTIKAQQFKAANAIVDLSGACNAQVYASKLLRADVSGPSNITYTGNPKRVDKDQSGMGNIEAE